MNIFKFLNIVILLLLIVSLMHQFGLAQDAKPKNDEQRTADRSEARDENNDVEAREEIGKDDEVQAEGEGEADNENVQQAVVKMQAVMALQAFGGEDVNAQRFHIAQRQLRYHVAFIDRCCDLTDRQIADYKAIDEKKLRELVDGKPKEKKRKKKKRGGMTAAFFAAGMQRTPAIDRQKIESAITNALSEKLTELQREQWKRALAAKKKFEIESAAEILAGFLDRELLLSDEQFRLIRSVLIEAEFEIENEEIQYLSSRYIPQDFPTRKIEKHLNKQQKVIIQSFNRITWNVFDNGNMHDQVDVHIELGDK